MSLSANALTTVAQLEASLELSGTGTSLEFWINAASDMIAQHCDRKFGRQTFTEYVKGYGTPLIHLANGPIESVTSVAEDRGGSALTEETDFRIEDRDKCTLERIGSRWPHTADVELSASPHPAAGMERPSIKVVYVAGYALAGGGRQLTNPAPAVGAVTHLQPYDLELACLELATLMYRSKGRNLALTAKQVGNASEQYGGSGAGMGAVPPAIADKLAAYCRVR